jgi:hypothetical protein
MTRQISIKWNKKHHNIQKIFIQGLQLAAFENPVVDAPKRTAPYPSAKTSESRYLNVYQK